eukprot:6869071-Alexandrium_andersonii.AAC.1
MPDQPVQHTIAQSHGHHIAPVCGQPSPSLRPAQQNHRKPSSIMNTRLACPSLAGNTAHT